MPKAAGEARGHDMQAIIGRSAGKASGRMPLRMPLVRSRRAARSVLRNDEL
jgi:hypothetical protein